MAKKVEGRFNLSQAIRDAIGKHPKGSARDVIDAVKKAHPGIDFNEKTAAVTWSKLRSAKRSTKRLVRKPMSGGRRGGGAIISALDAAAQLVEVAGGIQPARAILDKLADMAVPF